MSEFCDMRIRSIPGNAFYRNKLEYVLKSGGILKLTE